MSTKTMLKEYLEERGAFRTETHPLVMKAFSTISGEIPYRLKLSIALSEMVTLTSHIRKNIILHDDTIVPCNMITFALAKSGIAKDSSMNMVRKALKSGYDILDKERADIARTKAEKMAILDGKQKEEWLSYYEEPKALQAGLGTVEGIITHFSALEKGGIGAGSINSSEIGTELLTNGHMTDIVKTISIGYDLGKIPSKIIKSSENQTPSIEALPVNALFFGSEDAILYDNKIKNLFRTMFGVQLARRSLFMFTPEAVKPIHITKPEDVFALRTEERETTVAAQKELLTVVADIVEGTNQAPMPLSPEAQNAFDIYKEFNNLEAEDIKAQYPITKLSRRHKQWLALKLSGNFAILDGNDTVTEGNYIQAINTIEQFADDLMKFEIELIKEPYEMFVDFCKHNAEDRKLEIGLHTLRKLGYIPTSGSVKSEIEKLVNLSSSYDSEAIYTACDAGVCYEEPIRTDVAGVSFLAVSGTKSQRAKQCASGFEFDEASFDELEGLLNEDLAYSPFQFKDGIRGNENIVGGCKFVALDVDKSSITDEECHLLLEGVNHHIARTSDSENPMKFRVLVELDSLVEIPDRQWKYFLEGVADELGLQVDILPRSQIYFSYSGRDVLSEVEGSPLATRDIIMKSAKKLVDKPKPSKLSAKEQTALLEDKLETFGFAFNVENGSGSRALIRAAMYARDLGATHSYIENLMWEISNYWLVPLDKTRMEKTILSQVTRWF